MMEYEYKTKSFLDKFNSVMANANAKTSLIERRAVGGGDDKGNSLLNKD